MFLPNSTKRLFAMCRHFLSNVPTLFIKCADTLLFSTTNVGRKFLAVRTYLSEQRELCLLQLDALASLVVILLVEFKADEVALLFYTSNGGGAAAHTIV